MIGPDCNLPVMDAERHAKLCGARATTRKRAPSSLSCGHFHAPMRLIFLLPATLRNRRW
jgi:hypothetical protein